MKHGTIMLGAASVVGVSGGAVLIHTLSSGESGNQEKENPPKAPEGQKSDPQDHKLDEVTDVVETPPQPNPRIVDAGSDLNLSEDMNRQHHSISDHSETTDYIITTVSIQPEPAPNYSLQQCPSCSSEEWNKLILFLTTDSKRNNDNAKEQYNVSLSMTNDDFPAGASSGETDTSTLFSKAQQEYKKWHEEWHRKIQGSGQQEWACVQQADLDRLKKKFSNIVSGTDTVSTTMDCSTLKDSDSTVSE